MTENSQSMNGENGSKRAAWIAVYTLIALTVLVFGFLLLRVLLARFEVPVLSQLWAPNPNVLLLDALQQQRDRLDVILAGPCDSPGMGQYLRGEIGPLIRYEAPSTPSPTPGDGSVETPPAVNPKPGTSEGGDTPPSPPAILPDQSNSNIPVPAPGAPQLGSGEVLPPAQLRGLVGQSVVLVRAALMSGTGFAISPNTIVTNRHVVAQARDGQFFITSKYLGTEPVPARLLVTTADSEFGNSDFAVLQLQGGKPLTPLNIGDDPQPLESVIAAGYPGLAVETDSNDDTPDVVYSQGDVSVVQPQPNGTSLVIHTANISPGSSGGPLIDRCGTVVGVNTFVTTGDGATGRALYSLSGTTLAAFLKESSVDFNRPSATQCGAGAN
jgi:hypothetical protein